MSILFGGFSGWFRQQSQNRESVTQTNDEILRDFWKEKKYEKFTQKYNSFIRLAFERVADESWIVCVPNSLTVNSNVNEIFAIPSAFFDIHWTMWSVHRFFFFFSSFVFPIKFVYQQNTVRHRNLFLFSFQVSTREYKTNNEKTHVAYSFARNK